jgi:hypothetical protein
VGPTPQFPEGETFFILAGAASAAKNLANRKEFAAEAAAALVIPGTGFIWLLHKINLNGLRY